MSFRIEDFSYKQIRNKNTKRKKKNKKFEGLPNLVEYVQPPSERRYNMRNEPRRERKYVTKYNARRERRDDMRNEPRRERRDDMRNEREREREYDTRYNSRREYRDRKERKTYNKDVRSRGRRSYSGRRYNQINTKVRLATPEEKKEFNIHKEVGDDYIYDHFLVKTPHIYNEFLDFLLSKRIEEEDNNFITKFDLIKTEVFLKMIKRSANDYKFQEALDYFIEKINELKSQGFITIHQLNDFNKEIGDKMLKNGLFKLLGCFTYRDTSPAYGSLYTDYLDKLIVQEGENMLFYSYLRDYVSVSGAYIRYTPKRFSTILMEKLNKTIIRYLKNLEDKRYAIDNVRRNFYKFKPESLF